MIWQDIVIAVAQIFFIVALIPSITTQDKPAVLTSAMNMTLVWAISITQYTLDLWFSTITAVAIGVGHLVLFIQKVKINRQKR